MKKTLSLLLALLTLTTPALVACGDADNGNSPTTTATPVTTDAPTETTAAADTTAEETRLVANIPEDTDFKGYTFNIANGFHNQTKYTTNAIAPEDITGDVLNDAIFKRTATVEKEINVDIVDLDISQSKMKTSLQAGAAEFDLMTVDRPLGRPRLHQCRLCARLQRAAQHRPLQAVVGSECAGKAVD